MFNSYGIFSFLYFVTTTISYAEICPKGEHWVKAHSQSAYMRSDGTGVSGSYHKASCRKNPPSYAVWYERLKNGRPNKWENNNEKSKDWTDDEKERVLEALSDLPNELKLESVLGFYRMAESKQYELNPAAGFANNIVIYDSAFKIGSNLARVITHEFAHGLYRQISISERVSYAKAAEWDVSFNFETIKDPHFQLLRSYLFEQDSKNSVDEDFANNIEYFLFNSAQFKLKNSQVFRWIESKFGDKFKLGGKLK